MSQSFADRRFQSGMTRARVLLAFRSVGSAVRGGLLACVIGVVVGFVGEVQAHGPTVKISHSEMTPPLLNLYVGTTVHFSNTVSMPGGHIVLDEGGTIESPALNEPGDGWHYTFEKVGTYEIYLKQHPDAKTRINVVPKSE